MTTKKHVLINCLNGKKFFDTKKQSHPSVPLHSESRKRDPSHQPTFRIGDKEIYIETKHDSGVKKTLWSQLLSHTHKRHPVS